MQQMKFASLQSWQNFRFSDINLLRKESEKNDNLSRFNFSFPSIKEKETTAICKIIYYY